MKFVLSKLYGNLYRLIIIRYIKDYIKKDVIYLTNTDLYNKQAIKETLYIMAKMKIYEVNKIANEIFRYL